MSFCVVVLKCCMMASAVQLCVQRFRPSQRSMLAATAATASPSFIGPHQASWASFFCVSNMILNIVRFQSLEEESKTATTKLLFQTRNLQSWPQTENRHQTMIHNQWPTDESTDWHMNDFFTINQSINQSNQSIKSNQNQNQNQINQSIQSICFQAFCKPSSRLRASIPSNAGSALFRRSSAAEADMPWPAAAPNWIYSRQN